MSRLLIKATALAALVLSLLETTNAIGSAENYTGSICKDFVNYQVWVPPNSTISSIEASLIQEGIVAQNLKSVPTVCLEPFMEFVCSTNFARAIPSSTPSGKGNLIPNCDSPVDGTTSYSPPNGISYQPDGSCNSVTNLAGSISLDGNRTTVICPLPFIPDTMQGPGGTTTNANVCSGGCCLPCPAQYSLYREGSLETGYMVSDITRIVSTVLSAILLLSYIFLPDKLAHPSMMVFCQIIGAFLFSVVGFFSIIERKDIQCLDEINPSTQQNNMKCAIQGAIQVFSATLFCAWNTAVVLNLHLHMVWNSSWFARNYVITHTLCWGLPITLTAISLGMGEIQWNTGSYCFIAQEKASAIFFYPMGVFLFPTFLIHIGTFFHIARVTIASRNESSANSRPAAMPDSTTTLALTTYRHVVAAIQIQWRAALMASLAITLVVYYWLFYFFQFRKMLPEHLRPNIQNHFVGCLLNGGTQNSCAVELEPYLPPFSLMISAEVLVSAAGIASFIIFFKPSLIGEWRECFDSFKYFLFQEGRREKNVDEEFVAMRMQERREKIEEEFAMRKL
ncbi:hypothetical protein BGZ80_009240 [Entomortierella chlamydospora]|uniref:G-protein coupled receptors family 2 profile 2 domain-containing protein n=1 Tax=Entomortierella chlamydospora TaxID=101097 RepID=A0A9P6MX60_9FUNG|nr:hypothetical protein BGZ79_006200 [Entomortierella chlamydospora]KAG0016415.1 hypothetical protein BGZ80_009240 [Entomortierella chlamydospora]